MLSASISTDIIDGANTMSYHDYTVYAINIASPNEKNLYLCSIASAYARSIISREEKAETSISSVLSGRWKFVISASTR